MNENVAESTESYFSLIPEHEEEGIDYWIYQIYMKLILSGL